MLPCAPVCNGTPGRIGVEHQSVFPRRGARYSANESTRFLVCSLPQNLSTRGLRSPNSTTKRPRGLFTECAVDIARGSKALCAGYIQCKCEVAISVRRGEEKASTQKNRSNHRSRGWQYSPGASTWTSRWGSAVTMLQKLGGSGSELNTQWVCAQPDRRCCSKEQAAEHAALSKRPACRPAAYRPAACRRAS